MVNHTKQPGFKCRHVQNCEFVNYKGKKLLKRKEMKQGEGYKPMDSDSEEDNEDDYEKGEADTGRNEQGDRKKK